MVEINIPDENPGYPENASYDTQLIYTMLDNMNRRLIFIEALLKEDYYGT